MKKLIIKIGKVKYVLPYNNEVFSFEVSDKYVPKVGDCVRVDLVGQGCATFFKIESINDEGKIKSEHCVYLEKGECTIDLDYFWFSSETNFTQITSEELKAKYAEAGYDWDYETNEVKPLKWVPKNGDKVWFYSLLCEVVSYIFDKDNTMLQLLAEKGLLFPTEAECQKFADHCLIFHKK